MKKKIKAKAKKIILESDKLHSKISPKRTKGNTPNVLILTNNDYNWRGKIIKGSHNEMEKYHTTEK